MKRYKLMAWLLSVAMLTSIAPPVYADEVNGFEIIEEEDFFEEEIEDDFSFEEETSGESFEVIDETALEEVESESNESFEGDEVIIAEGSCGEALTWQLDAMGVLTIMGSGAMNGYATGRYGGQPWHSYMESIRKVVIADGVTEIGDYAFYAHVNVEDVVFSETVTTIGMSAFEKCSGLAAIDLPESLKAMESRCFAGCILLEEARIPGRVAYFGDNMFSDCSSLQTLYFDCQPGLSRYEIGLPPVGICEKLEQIEVNPAHPYLSSREGILFFNSNLMQYPAGKKDEIYRLDYGKISDAAFAGNSYLKTLVIGQAVTELGRFILGSSSVIERSAIENIVVTGKVKQEYVYGPFAYADYFNLYYPADLSEDDLSFLMLGTGEHVTPIPFDEHLVLSYETVEEATCTEDGYAQGTCLICDEVFTETLPAKNHDWTEWEITQEARPTEDGVRERYCLRCDEIEYDYFPYIFDDASILDDGICGDDLYWYLYDDGVLRITGSGEMYDYTYNLAEQSPWSAYTDDIIYVRIEEGVTSIGDCAFYDHEALEEVMFADSITDIGFCAFASCVNLRDFDLPESLKVLGQQCFQRCKSLTSVTIPYGVTRYEGMSFEGCTSLTYLYIDWLFTGPDAFEVYTSPIGVCENLEEIVVNTGHPFIASIDGVLYGDGKMLQYPAGKKDESYTVADECTDVFDHAFSRAKYLKTLIIPESAECLGGNLFGSANDTAKLRLENIIICGKPVADPDGVFCFVKNADLYYPSGLSEEVLAALAARTGENFDLIPYDEHVVLSWTQISESTCTEKGLLEGKCVICGEIVTEKLPLKDHEMTEWAEEKAAGCETVGSEERHCKHCDHSEKREIPAKGHEMTDWTEEKAAGCETVGSEERHCKHCDYSEKRENPAKGHEWEENYRIDVEPTCTTEGIQSIHCKKCDETKDQKPVPKLEHDYDDWEIIKEASCETAGSKEHHCKHCDHSEKQEIPAKGHEMTEWEVEKAAGCETAGSEERHCKHCDYSEKQEIPAKGHQFGEWQVTKKPTYAKEGEQVRSCSVCEKNETEVIPKLEPADQIEAFVIRMYKVCLNREPDPTGLDYWATPLREQTLSGLDCARGIVYSNEFQNKEMTDEEFLTYMYQAFLGRNPDKGGMSYWLNELAKGKTRDDVFYGFADSDEFDRICKEYGIIKKFDDEPILAMHLKLNVSSQKIKNGDTYQLVASVSPDKTTNKAVIWTSSKPKIATVSDQGLVTALLPGTTVITCTTADGSKKQATCTITVDPADDIEVFVIRLYTTCLNRNPDAAGLNYWTDRLRTKKETGRSIAHGFVFSDEFIKRGYSDEQFIDQMYKAFFGRNADSAGKTYWLNEMKKGKTREQVFDGFVMSNEFDKLCKQYGIDRD